MESQEKLIGYDIREMWLGMNDWPQARQNEHLIKRDIEKPLSVDTLIWKSVFEINNYNQLPNFRGPIQNLWEDITMMQQYFTHISSTSQPSWTIAISLSFDILTIEEKDHWPISRMESFNPGNYSMNLIGYDIADRFLGSGLVDAGYSESERTNLEKQWSEHLNNYHLFTEYALASKFKQLANSLVGHHAPFFVYALYQISS